MRRSESIGAPLLPPNVLHSRERATRSRIPCSSWSKRRLVRKGGIEPPWSNDHRLLRPARLPIPPLSHVERGPRFSVARSGMSIRCFVFLSNCRPSDYSPRAGYLPRTSHAADRSRLRDHGARETYRRSSAGKRRYRDLEPPELADALPHLPCPLHGGRASDEVFELPWTGHLLRGRDHRLLRRLFRAQVQQDDA